MRKRIWIPLALVAASAVGFFGIAPGYVEGTMNVVDGKPLIKVTPEAEALHKTLTIVDLHSDTMMWNRDPLERADRGHMDLPRLQDGNVTLQLFSSVSKTPKGQNYDGNRGDTDNITLLSIAQLQPVKTWFSLAERTLYHGERAYDAARRSGGKMVMVSDTNSMNRLMRERALGKGTVGAMMTIEGLHDLEGKAANLDRFYSAGFRMAGLTHFFDNDLAGSMHGVKKGGLTPFGREIVRKMEEKGMILDIAHLSHAGVAEVLASARRPVVSSHGGVQATCKVNRNLTDEEIKGVAATGGLIGIGYWDAAVCDTSPRAAAKAMKHVRDLVGIEHVALGSDYDGATTVRFDTSKLAQVTQALVDEGFTGAEIQLVMGGNALRVLRAGIVPMAAGK